ncbi:hypothetical protein JAAARDRAFT_181268 [Jaapia argillacea MUCL 33604]|uniref:Uncharacterized protein n=1 Tax=Jaapia argillacea MUCL 33604 TaxID=933084 RepID=A0A067PWK8_9AGAM|nr:hypothetical protein JAAARDRAFT_181268 [Jaapia argillacea MUCL 33604]
MAEATTLSVHRCRFVDFTPSAITALAFPPLPLPSIKGKKSAGSRKLLKFGTLAIGRANGNVEVCEWTGTENSQIEAPQAWTVRKTLSGPHPSKVDSLAFTIRYPELLGPDDVPTCSDLRLFTAGGGSELVEWDLEKGSVKRTISSQGGSIWCISPNPSSTLLALGCEDGSVRLLSIEDDNLVHQRRFDRVKSRLLSIAWGPPVPKQKKQNSSQTIDDGSSDDDDDDWIDSWLVTGCSDSSLRKWDIQTGRTVERMGTDKVKGERTLVWSVGVLGDGTIVSGDSLGMVKFWDPKTCTQLESFQGHGADVLCLTIGPEGTTVYTSGVDQKITQFMLVKTSPSDSSSLLRSSSRWIQSTSRRLHSHDVRALSIWPPYTALPQSYKRQFPMDVAPILVSGGLDMSVVATPAALPTSTVTKVQNPLSTSTVATFEDSYHRRLAYSSGPAGTSSVSIARGARLVLCRGDSVLCVWRIGAKKGEDVDMEEFDFDAEEEEGEGWEKVLEMELNVQTNLVASAISGDGRWLAVSDQYEAKLFQLELQRDNALKPRRIRDFSSILQPHIPTLPTSPPSTGASAFAFTPDSSKLVLATTMSSYILVVDLGVSSTDGSITSPRVLRRFDHHRMRNVLVGERVVKGRADEDSEGSDIEMHSPTDVGDDAKPIPATVSRISISTDGQWVATTDDHCRTHVFNLDSIQHHCVLPSFPQPIQALSFSTSHASTLVMALANNSIHIFDVETRQFPDWARGLCGSLPKRFTHLHDPVVGVTFDTVVQDGGPSGSLRNVALFWGSTWICKVKFDAPIGWGGFSKKRRRETKKMSAVTQNQRVTVDDHQQQSNFKLVTHYRPLLFVEFLDAGELLVVERPLVDVLSQLPPAYFKPKYGAT